AFGSLPDVDWNKVPGDLANLLGVGIRQAIDDGIEGEPGPNALAELLKLLGLDNSSSSSGSALDLASLGDSLVGNALGSALPSQPESTAPTTFDLPAAGSTTTGSGSTVQLTQNASGSQTPPAATKDDAPAQRKRPVLDLVEHLGNSVATPKTSAVTGTGSSRPTPLRDAAKQASDGAKKTVQSGNEGGAKAGKGAQKAVRDTVRQVSERAKPKEKAAEGS